MCGGAKTKGRVNFYKWEKAIIFVATKLHTKNFGLTYYQNCLSLHTHIIPCNIYARSWKEIKTEDATKPPLVVT